MSKIKLLIASLAFTTLAGCAGSAYYDESYSQPYYSYPYTYEAEPVFWYGSGGYYHHGGEGYHHGSGGGMYYHGHRH